MCTEEYIVVRHYILVTESIRAQWTLEDNDVHELFKGKERQPSSGINRKQSVTTTSLEFIECLRYKARWPTWLSDPLASTEANIMFVLHEDVLFLIVEKLL